MGCEKRDRKRQRKDLVPLNNLLAVIVMLFIISSVLSSYVSYTNSRRILQEMTGELVSEAKARVCVNKPPSISGNCSSSATVGSGYYCDVDASDPDNDTITFFDDAVLFGIDSSLGEIIFTPQAGDVGSYNITVTASDGKGCSNSNATYFFVLTVSGVPGPPPGPGGGGGGGAAPVECEPQWECTPWSSCGPDGVRTRRCYSLNNCLVDKPRESEECIYLLPPALRRPRPPAVPGFEFCDFDVEGSCLRNVGVDEDWLMDYDGEVGVLNFFIDDSMIDISMDDERFISVPLRRIKGVDMDGDGVDDIEFILHDISGGRADLTGRLVSRREVVVERPVYIQALPGWMSAILMFVYSNACAILIVLLVLVSVLIYRPVIDRFGKKDKKG